MADGVVAGVWFAIPVASSQVAYANATFQRWKAKGYRTAALIDPGSQCPDCDMVVACGVYRGWAWAVNRLISHLPPFAWAVTGGHDVYPDPDKAADAIAAECVEHFRGTLGVMQPTGDSYGALAGSEPLACVSPWIGAEFCRRANRGKGPLWEGYPHYHADGELMLVAQRLGRMWFRPDLVQYHDHYLRRGEDAPQHLERWQATCSASAALYRRRQADGFPGSELA
jgi:hypothetical protein